MTTEPDYFSAYLDLYGVSTKPQRVDEAARRKQAELDRVMSREGARQAVVGRQTGRGYDSASEIERDLRNLTPFELELKYGADVAREMTASRARAEQEYQSLNSGDRSTMQIIGDSALGLAQGGINGVSGLIQIALGGGAAGAERLQSAYSGGKSDGSTEATRAGKKAALGVARATQAVTEILDSQKSGVMQSQSILARDESAQAQRDRAKKFREEGGESSLVAQFGRFGRAFLDTVEINAANPTVAGDIAAQGVGSLVTGSVVGKGISKVTGATTSKAPMATSIALQESGGVYQEAVIEAYDLLADRKNLTEDQKIAIASRAAATAAATQAPIAAVTGLMVARFEANPFSFGVGGFTKNTLNETAEEAIQSGSSTISKNLGLSMEADPGRDVMDGVGEETALGLIGGATTGAIVSAPPTAAKNAIEVAEAGRVLGVTTLRAAAWGLGEAKKASSGWIDSLVEAADQAKAANEEKSVVSTSEVRSKMSAAVDFLKQTKDRVVESLRIEGAPEQATDYIEKLDQTASFDIAELGEDVPLFIRESLEGSSTKFEAIERLAKLVQGTEEGSPDQLSATRLLMDMKSSIENVTQNDLAEGLETMSVDTPVMQLVGMVESALVAVNTNPMVQRATQKAKDLLAKGSQFLRPVTAEEIDTPEGQRLIKDTLSAAEHVPSKVNPEAVEAILEHADQGRVPLNPQQRATLLSAKALILAELELERSKAEEGLLTDSDLVSGEIITMRDAPGEETKTPSLSGHLARIQSAYRAGNNELAKAQLRRLLMFAQHMQNKTAALNEHIAEGGGKKETGKFFQALPPKGSRFVKSAKPVYVQPTSSNSVELAQRIAKEAQIVGEAANRIAEAFAELGEKGIELVQLDPSLQGDIRQVVESFRKGTAKPGQSTAPAQSKQENPVAKEAPAKKQPKQSKQKEASAQLELPLEQPQPKQEDPRPARIREADTARLKSVLEKQRSGRLNFRPDTIAMIEAELERRALEEALSEAPAEEVVQTPEAPERAERAPEPETEPVEAQVETVPEEAAAEAAPVEPSVTAEQVETIVGEALEEALEKQAAQNDSVQDAPALSENSVIDPLSRVDQLLGHEPGTKKKSLFSRTYKEKSGASRLGFYDGLGFVRQALSSVSWFRSYVPDQTANMLTPQVISAYEEYLGNADAMTKIMRRRLKQFLKSPAFPKKDPNGPSRWDRLSSDPGYNRLDNTLATNIAKVVDGTLEYDETLLEGAVLAGLQWALQAQQSQGIVDEGSVLSILGVTEDAVVFSNEDMTALVTRFREGPTVTSASRALATKILSYWGVEPVSDASIAHYEGIAEAVGKEVLEAMIELGAIKVLDPVGEVFGKDNPLPDGRNPMVLVPFKVVESTPLHSFPDAIELVVKEQPERATWVGAPPQEVAKTQLHNPAAKLTTEQRAAARANQNTVYTANEMTLAFYEQLEEAGILELFASGEIDENVTNKQHLKSLEGRNRTFSSAWRSVQKMASQMRNYAQATGTALADVPVYFEFTFNSMNRLQMLGSNNPQSSKLMREFLLPTKATLNMSSPGVYDTYMLAIAQHIGLKVHQEDHALLTRKVEEKFRTDLAGSLDGFLNWIEGGSKALPDGLVSTLKQELGSKLSPGAVHAVMDYARLLLAEDRSAFTTSMYLEADGVTNGPINAMVMFSPGEFTEAWVNNIAKGGLFVGETGMTINKLVAGLQGAKDLYATTAMTLEQLLGRWASEMSQSDGGQESVRQTTMLFEFMDMFLGDDLSMTVNEETGDMELSIDRGLTKNPLTITIYGSGAKGIGNKLSGAVVEKINELMSASLTRKAENPELTLAEAMFPGRPDKFEKFAELHKELTGKSVEKIEPATYALSRGEFNQLSESMRLYLVEPMRASIGYVVGEHLGNAASAIQTATQVQGLVFKGEFKSRLDAKIAEKRAKDPDYRPSDFITFEELREISSFMEEWGAVISTGDQNLAVTMSQTSDLVDRYFSRSLSGNLPTMGFVSGPTDPGVRGIPTSVISAADGNMMQKFGASVEGPARTLPVYDGLNMPIDAVADMSQRINGAVHQAWQNNPIRGMANSFKLFVEKANIDALDEQGLKAVATSLFGLKEARKNSNKEAILKGMTQLSRTLETMALRMDARIAALAEFNLSIDHMAGAQQPFVQSGKRSLEGLTAEEKAQALNEVYLEKYAELKRKRKEALEEEAATEAAKEAEIAGQLHPTGVRVITEDRFFSLAQELGASKAQTTILKDMAGALRNSGYTVVTGSIDQLRAYANQTGLPAGKLDRPDAQVNGVTFAGSKVVMLINPSGEVLVHELVHAATFDKVQSYYDGTLDANNSTVVEQAIKRTEELMRQFLDMTLQDEGSEFFNVAHEIQEHLLNGRQAAALNEFMAWGLTNQALAEKLGKTKATPMAQLVRSVVDAIKKLIWGRVSKAPAVLDDMFTNLRFNTAIIAQYQPDVRSEFAETVLYHSTAYGSDERLKHINRVLNRKVVRHLQAEIGGANSEKAKEVIALQAVDALLATKKLSNSVSAVFDMTAQEKTTFETIAATMSSLVQLDGNALAKAGDIFAHVTKTLKVEDFMDDPMSLDPNDRYQARAKYQQVIGGSAVDTDRMGRTSLLPVFLALSLTNNDMRRALSRIEMPTTERNAEGTLDARLENIGMAAMDLLGDYVSGTNRSADNLTQVMDALIDQIAKTAEERQSFITVVSDKTTDAVSKINDAVVQGIQYGAKKTYDLVSPAADSEQASIKRTAARAVRAFAGIVDNDKAGQMAEDLMSSANRTQMPKVFSDLLRDFIGRTEDNAPIFDLIKRVHSWVQTQRQVFRENLPAFFAKQFTKAPTEAEWASMFRGMGKTDLVALRKSMTRDAVLDLFKNPTAVDQKIAQLEGAIVQDHPTDWPTLQAKAKQLAVFMNTGVPGSNLLRNAEAVSRLLGEQTSPKYAPSSGLHNNIDQLITLYALRDLKQADKDVLARLAREEGKGMDFMLGYLEKLRKDEFERNWGMADLNYYKGHMPTVQTEDMTIIVASDARQAELEAQSYVRIGDYRGSNLERGAPSRGYYAVPVTARAKYRQGIMQTIQQTAGGVDIVSGLTHGRTVAGAIVDEASVRRAWRGRHHESASEPLLPVFGYEGEIVAYERSVDPAQLSILKHEENLANSMGIWRGRQFEEAEGRHWNTILIARLNEMYERDLLQGRGDEYVDLFRTKDPILKDTIQSLPGDTLRMIQAQFGDSFMVRKDLLDDAVGYRDASVRNLWDKQSRMDPKAMKIVQGILVKAFGNKAYQYAVKAESLLQNAITDLRLMIVVKSVVVPMANMTWNVIQLATRGVPLLEVGQSFPRKAAEVTTYLRTRERQIEAEAELAAAGSNIFKVQKLEAEIQNIIDQHKRLSIWPLIQAGEFTSISDGMIDKDDMALSQGRLGEYFENLVDRLPQGVRTAARYGIVARDTALFKGLQKSVEYGDFLAKATLYDHLTKKKGLKPDEALARIGEEFVNYDRLPGRTRGYAEQIGLLWFWNFKIRSTKVPLNMVRHNPVHALLAMNLPVPTDFLGPIGSPLTDNAVAVVVEGRAEYSIGPDMALRAPELLPLMQVIR